jgi:geranylgeranyl pyrophosphate synthase
VNASEGIKKTTKMALEHVDSAIRSLEKLCDSPAKQALVDIARLVIDRKS